MQSYSDNIHKLIDIRVFELEQELSKFVEYVNLTSNKKIAFAKLKNKIENADWNDFDEFLCAENAQTDYLINFFYRKGLKDGIKLPAFIVDGQKF